MGIKIQIMRASEAWRSGNSQPKAQSDLRSKQQIQGSQLLNTVANVKVPLNVEDFLTNGETVGASGSVVC
jgi:hypothetical protein